MKKIIVILVVLIAVVGGTYFLLSKPVQESVRKCEDGFRFDPALKQCIEIEVPKKEKKLDFSSIQITIPDTDIKVSLLKGSDSIYSSSYDIEGSNSKGSIRLNPSEVEDYSETLAVVPILVESGGTGDFSYLALINKDTNTHLDSLFIGDRIEVTTIETANPVIKLNYKNRAISQSFSDKPTIPTQLVLRVTNNKLEEIMQLQNAIYSDVDIKAPTSNSAVNGDFVIKGSIPGTWYVEAVAQFKIIDDTSSEIAFGSVQALSNWMTTQRVPFEIKLNTSSLKYSGNAKIIIQSENAQGGPEGELKVKKLEIPVVIK